MATNPLMLVIIALIRYERAHLIEERVQLYHRAVTTLVDTWAQWRSVGGVDVVAERTLPLDRVLQVWAAVADWMHETRPTGVVHRNELVRELTRVLTEREFDDDRSADELAARYFAVVAGSGLLEERATDIFAFWHPTFEEFLAAIHRATPTGNAIARILPLRGDPRWREVILLAVGYVGLVQLDGNTATEMIDAIASEAPEPSEVFFHHHVRLAASALTDYPGMRRTRADALLQQLTAAVHASSLPGITQAFPAAARALGRLRPSPELVAGLESLSSHEAWSIRMEVARLAGNGASENENCATLCERLLADTNPDVRCYAGFGLVRAHRAGPSHWRAVLENFDSRYTGLEPTLRGYIASLDEPELLTMVEMAGPQLSSAIRILRRAGRLNGATHMAVQQCLQTLRDDHPSAHLRALDELEGPGESTMSCALGHLDTEDPSVRLEAARVLVTDSQYESRAIDALLSVLGEPGCPDDLKLEAIRAVPETIQPSNALADALAMWFVERRRWSYEADLARGIVVRLPSAVRERVISRWRESTDGEVRLLIDRVFPQGQDYASEVAREVVHAGEVSVRARLQAAAILSRLEVPVPEYIDVLRLFATMPETFATSGTEPAVLLGLHGTQDDRERSISALYEVAENEGRLADAAVALAELGVSGDSLGRMLERIGLPHEWHGRLRILEALVDVGATERALDVAASVAHFEMHDEFDRRYILQNAAAAVRRAIPLDMLEAALGPWLESSDKGERLIAITAMLEADLYGRATDSLGRLLGLEEESLSAVVRAASSGGTAETQRAAWRKLADVTSRSENRDQYGQVACDLLVQRLAASDVHGAAADDDIPF